MENYPGIEEIGGFELCEKFLNHAKRYDLEIRENEVASVEPGVDYHEVVLTDGTRLNTHAVILAVGGSARKLGVPGEIEQYGKGVSYCATCDGFFFRGKTVVVVGGGDTALEDALYLSKICSKVYLVHRREEFRGSRILQQRVFAESRITLVLSSVLQDIVANDEGVTSVNVKHVETGETQGIATDGVFIFVGFKPNNGLVPAGVKMNAAGYVVTDEKCETNLPAFSLWATCARNMPIRSFWLRPMAVWPLWQQPTTWRPARFRSTAISLPDRRSSPGCAVSVDAAWL